MAKQATQTVMVQFAMVDPEGSAAVRVVAGHAQRVADGWSELSRSMFDLADSLDDLCSTPDPDDADDGERSK